MGQTNQYEKDVFEVIDTFNIEKVRNCAHLNHWLAVKGDFTPFEEQLMEQSRIIQS